MATTEIVTDYTSIEDHSATLGPTADPNATRNIVTSVFITLICCAALILNILVLVVWCKVERLRKATLFFQIAIVVVDIIGAVFWGALSITAAVARDWILGRQLCTFQGIISTWCYVMTTTIFTGIATEKCFKLVFPSRHVQAFQKNLVIILLVVMSIYSGVIALFPIMSWGELHFIQQEIQCSFLFEKSVSHLEFMLIVGFVFPLLAGLLFYGVAALKVWYIHRKQGKNGKLVLEEDKSAQKRTFGQLLKRLEAKYKNVANRKDKPKLGTAIVWDDRADDKPKDFDPDDDSASEISDDDDGEVFRDYSEGRKKIQESKERKRRVYHLRRRDITFALISFFVFIVYMVIWLPSWVASFEWTFREINPDVHLVCTLVSYLGLFYKPLMYLMHKPLRQEAAKILAYKKKHTAEHDAEAAEQLIDDEIEKLA